MMAISMVVLGAFVGAGGLGDDIIRALKTLDVGASFDAGLAHRPAGHDPRPPLGVGEPGLGPAAHGARAVQPRAHAPPRGRRASRSPSSGSRWASPRSGRTPSRRHGTSRSPTRSTPRWTGSRRTSAWLTDWFKNVVSNVVPQPAPDLAHALAVVAHRGPGGWRRRDPDRSPRGRDGGHRHGRRRAAPGVAAGDGDARPGARRRRAHDGDRRDHRGPGPARSDACSQILRPINDAAQTMPSFVYLMPAVALFERHPLHGDPRRDHLRDPGRHPAHRGRDPRRVRRRRSRRPRRPAPPASR